MKIGIFVKPTMTAAQILPEVVVFGVVAAVVVVGNVVVAPIVVAVVVMVNVVVVAGTLTKS